MKVVPTRWYLKILSQDDFKNMKKIIQSKLKSAQNRFACAANIKMRGFTLGISMIIMSVLVAMSIGMSTLLLRDLKIASVTQKASVAYNLADAALSCTSSYESHLRKLNGAGSDIGGLFPEVKPYSYLPANYTENYTGNNYHYTQESITCFGKEILDQSGSDPLNITSVESANGSNAPSDYIGGVKTTVRIQTDYMKSSLFDSCAQVVIYHVTGKDKLFVSSGKVPCTGSQVIEKVIVKSVQ